MKNKLLIWDIDGTLISSKGCGRRAMDKTFATLYNIENGFDNITMAGRLDYSIVKDAFINNNIAFNDISKFLNKYENILREELNVHPSPLILPGVLDILTKTSEYSNVFHVLGTGNCEVGARLKLSHLGLDKFFEIGGFGDDDLQRWEIIQRAITNAEHHYKMKFANNDIYVIGDTPADIECGKRLNVRSVAVATGSYDYEELIQYSPDYLLYDLTEIKVFLELIAENIV